MARGLKIESGSVFGHGGLELTMRIWMFSDQHLTPLSARRIVVPPFADVCICAGDCADGGPASAVAWLGENVSHLMPVIFVAGNHEFYGSSIAEGLIAAQRAAHYFPHLHFLDDDVATVGGVRFVGSTLWTDFDLFGQPDAAISYAETGINDYREIRFSELPYRRFLPSDALDLHRRSLRYMDVMLSDGTGLPTVVVSHHAPSRRSLPERYKNDPLSPCFASNLDDFISRHQPTLWVHGHIHQSCDYIIGRTRVVCNPKGYPREATTSGFNPELVVEVAL